MSLDLIVFLVAFGAILAFFTIKIIILNIKDKKHYSDLLEQMEQPLELPEAKAVGARVILKTERIEKWGSTSSSSHRIVYEMTFDTDEREVLTFKVGPDIYYRYNELDTATLVTVNGEFFDFSDGEVIETNESADCL